MAPARSRRLALVILALALLGLAVARPALVLPPVARFLVTADPTERADVVVSLAGEWLAERAFAARDLYRAGRAPHVLLSQSIRPPLSDEIRRLGIPIVPEHDVNRQILAVAGVPATAVELLPPTDNTLGEAQAVARLTRERGWSAIIVVTSKFHTRRACWTFRRVLRDAVRIYCHPSAYDTFDPDRWWQVDKMALTVASEYLKLAANFLSYGWRPPPEPSPTGGARSQAPSEHHGAV